MRGWRLALRLARREALRARGRSVLVLVLVLLPVLAVTAADVVYRTARVSAVEGLDRHIGASDARVTFLGDAKVEQGIDPDTQVTTLATSTTPPPQTLATIRSVLGPRTRGVVVRDGQARVVTAKGVTDVSATELDLRSALARGLFTLDRGRLPRSVGEVVVTPVLAQRGPGLGSTLRLADGTRRTVVGVVDSASSRDQAAVAGPVGSLAQTAETAQTGWLVDVPGGVSWLQVRRLNAFGATVTSRSVITDPPPRSELPAVFRQTNAATKDTLSVLALVVAMVLLEVVLLAGPAFAVGARRQQRTLALLGAAGGMPRHMRRVVLANGVVLGGVAAVLGVVLGVVTGWVLVPLIQQVSSDRFGPLDVSVRDLAAVAAFGLLSAVLAAVAPAWSASRQDVVAVLAGRRGDRSAGVRSPVLGLVLLGVGVALAAYGARSAGGEITIALSALISVVAMILLVPIVMQGVGRAVRRLPLAIRYAARDAARHRTRTVPAVAAVAATVAGVVALGIGVTSNETGNRRTYTPQLPLGDAVVFADAGNTGWDRLRSAVATTVPAATVTALRGIALTPTGEPDQQLDVSVTAPGAAPGAGDDYQPIHGASVLVDDGSSALARLPLGLTATQVRQARGALVAGRVVVLSPTRQAGVRAQISVQVYGTDGEPTGSPVVQRVSATYLRVPADVGRADALLPPATASSLALPVVTDALVVRGARIDARHEEDLRERLGAASATADVYVERGYQASSHVVVVQLVLAVLGLVLMLGGTLTATFLALSDARGDLATLAAVGAEPRVRRRVAAAYAAVVGGVGAVLGAVVGFVPGIAVSYPLTRRDSAQGAPPAHFIDVPWLLVIGVVVLLPVLTSVVVGVTARGRLPLVARLD